MLWLSWKAERGSKSNNTVVVTGDFSPYITVETASSLLSSKLSTSVAGVPDHKTITFEAGGFFSPPVSISASAGELTEALAQLFEPICPVELSQKKLARTAFKF